MSDTPAPYPASTQSKGWRFEVNTEQVKKSETWLRARTGYVRAHLLLLWTEAWEQSPCGSLPADDELIALMLGMESGDFAANRAVLMRGWWLAADGRLYHDIIVARVLDMIEKRMSNAERARRSRETKAQSHGANASVTRDAQVTDEHAPREFDTKNQEPRTSNTTPDGVVGAASAAAPGKPAANKRGKRLPDEWTLPKAWGDWSLSEYLHWTPEIVRFEAAKFADHWRAKAGKDAAKTDWPATWRNWCRSEICQRAHPPPGQGTEGNYARQMRERVEEAAGSLAHVIAAKAPGSPRTPTPWEVAIENNSRTTAIGMDRPGVLEADGQVRPRLSEPV